MQRRCALIFVGLVFIPLHVLTPCVRLTCGRPPLTIPVDSSANRRIRRQTVLYITDIHALNLPCALGTTGDWHHSAIQWDSPRTLESSESPFGDWGIEADRGIRHSGQTIEHANVANHVRACLDMIERGRLTCAQGMREDFLDGNRTFDQDVFSRVALLRSRDNWNEIDAFMKREYGMDWVDWKAEMLGDLQRKSPSRGGGPASRSDATPANQHAKHEEVASAFLAFIGQDSPLVLAGEASLIFCYGLDQFSESFDFDSTDQQAKPEEYVQAFPAQMATSAHRSVLGAR